MAMTPLPTTQCDVSDGHDPYLRHTDDVSIIVVQTGISHHGKTLFHQILIFRVAPSRHSQEGEEEEEGE